MIDLNKIVLVGRLTKDIELRKTPNNVSVCDFTVAVNRRRTADGEKKADFLRCTAWRQSAEFLSNYASQGSLVCVEGSLQNANYQGADGKMVYQDKIVVDSVQVLNTKSSSTNTYNEASYNNNNDYQPSQQTFTPSVQNEYDNSDEYDEDSNYNISSDDLPFY